MPRNLYIALILTVIAAAATTVWIAGNVTSTLPGWIVVLPLGAAVIARLIWSRQNPR